MIKRILVSVCIITGALFLAELVMPGHLDRLLAYLEGNWSALSSWVAE
jgi:hypothetical protein